jgi:hypothetical protein
MMRILSNVVDDTGMEDVASLLHREMKGGAKQLMKGGLWKVLR